MKTFLKNCLWIIHEQHVMHFPAPTDRRRCNFWSGLKCDARRWRHMFSLTWLVGGRFRQRSREFGALHSYLEWRAIESAVHVEKHEIGVSSRTIWDIYVKTFCFRSCFYGQHERNLCLPLELLVSNIRLLACCFPAKKQQIAACRTMSFMSLVPSRTHGRVNEKQHEDGH